MQWYIVEEDMTLTKISTDFASETIALDCLEEVSISYYNRAFVNSANLPVIIQGNVGLEGAIV